MPLLNYIAGRFSEIRWSQLGSTLPVLTVGGVPTGDVDTQVRDLWIDNSSEALPVKDVDIGMARDLISFTPKRVSWKANPMIPSYVSIGATVTASWSMLHETQDEPNSFVKFCLANMTTQDPVTLAFLDRKTSANSTDYAYGMIGNWFLSMDMVQSVLGLQSWRVSAAATGYFDILTTVRVAPQAPSN